jgi:hypothetical protein
MPPSDLAGFTKQQLTVEMLAGHGQCRLQVSGSSMLPALWPGDTVLIEKQPLAQLDVGDIVLYQRAGRLFLHRLVDLRQELGDVALNTRGDAVPHDDPPVLADCLLGVLGGVRRGDEWVAVPKKMSTTSRLAAILLGRSSLLVRLLLRLRPRENSAIDRELISEVLTP